MLAVRARFEKGRSIDMTDTQRLEVRSDRGSIVDSEFLVELQPVSGAWNRGGHQAGSIVQQTLHGANRPGSPRIMCPHCGPYFALGTAERLAVRGGGCLTS